MSDAIITNNLISMNKGTGVYMGLGMMGFIYKNEITKNENGVIMISSQNKLMLNRITNNLMNGVYLMTKDDILNDSDVKMNLISHNKMNGILVEGMNNMTNIQSNYNISENGGCGIMVSDKADVKIVNNFIYYNTSQGVLLQESTTSKVHLNNIFKNIKANIALGGENSGEHLIISNVIHGSCSEGIYMVRTGSAIICKNEIFNNYDGMVIEESCPEIKNNKIRNNSCNGILICKGSCPLVQNNQITENEVAGILIVDISEPKIYSNQFDNNEINLASANNNFKISPSLDSVKGRNIIPKKEKVVIF